LLTNKEPSLIVCQAWH